MTHKISSSNSFGFDEGKRQGGRSGSYTNLKLKNMGKADYQEDHNKQRCESSNPLRKLIKRIFPKKQAWHCLRFHSAARVPSPARTGRVGGGARAHVVSRSPLISFKTSLDLIQLGQEGVRL